MPLPEKLPALAGRVSPGLFLPRRASGPRAGRGKGQYLEAALFENWAAHASSVDGQIVESAAMRFLDPRREQIGIQAAVAERREFSATSRTVSHNGSVHWVESKGRGVYATDGTMTRMHGTSMDITEHKLAEEALRASEERFRNQYKGFPLPTYSWLQIGDDFVVQDYNDAAEATLGVGIHNFVGRRSSEVYADTPEVMLDLQT